MTVGSVNWGAAPTINSLVDQGSWDRLAGLGDKFKEAQKSRLLASLGDDPEANKRLLLQSGYPDLAQLGLNYQQKDIDRLREDQRYSVTDKRAQELLDIQKAAAARAAADAAQADRDRREAGKLIGGFGQAAPPAATPFPAPLPGAQPQAAMPPTPQQQPFPAPLPPPQQPQAAPQAAPSPAWEATPRVSAQFQPAFQPQPTQPMPAALDAGDNSQPAGAPPYQSPFPPEPPAAQAPAAPPVKAADDNQGLPEWAQDPSGLAGRAASNLISKQPAAAAGISRDQLGAMYANPITRPLATAMLQKMYDPGTWTYQQVGDKLVGTNNKSGEVKVVMKDTKPLVVGSHALVPDDNGGYRDIAPQAPIQLDPDKRLVVPDGKGGFTDATPGGAAPVTKQEREAQGYFQAGKSLGMTDQQARAYAGNKGKVPGREDLSITEKKMVDDKTKEASAGEDVLANINQLKELSKTAYSGWAASKRAAVMQAILPGVMIPQGAIDTTEYSNLALQNVARQAKAIFGARLAVAEVKLLSEIESTPEMSDAARQRILTNLHGMIKRNVDKANAEAEGIRNKTFFKPGGGQGAAPAGAAADPLGLR